MSGARYLIDTSVFFQAYKAYYSFRLCPGFWDGLVSLHNQGRIFSIDRVFDEICYGEEDELTNWAKASAPKTFFAVSTSPRVIEWYRLIQIWANSQAQFFPAAKAQIADGADAWLIAYAGANDFTVVTGEVYSPTARNRIPIPNVCKANDFKVPCVDVFQMLDRLGIRFVGSQ